MSTAKEFLFKIPPDLSSLASLTISPEEATHLAWEYANECWYEDARIEERYWDYEGYLSWCNKEPNLIPGLHSTYLYEVMAFLLEKGANPNYTVHGDYCLMQNIIHTVNGYVAADTLRLLLEHGGDPNLLFDGEALFDDIDFDVGFDAVEQEDRRRFDSLVHCWLVLIGFGGKPRNGTTPLDLFDEWDPETGRIEFQVEKLKDHRNYIFGLTTQVNRGNAPTIHIFDKRTYWEIARL